MSELETDIGEQSDLKKRNNGAGSGLSAQQKTAVIQSPTQANATVNGKPATQNITANVTSNSSNNPVDNKTEKYSDIEKKQKEDSHKSKQNLKKQKKVDAVHKKSQKKYNEPRKIEHATDAVNRQQEEKKSNKKNIKEKKKKINRYQSDKNKNVDQVSCSKAKKYPTCMQIYRGCMREKSRCNQVNSKKKNDRIHQEKNSNEKSTVKDIKRLKTKSDRNSGKKETHRNHRTNAQHTQYRGKIVKGNHKVSDNSDSSKLWTNGAKDRKRPISKHHGGKKVSPKKPTAEKRKKVDDEIRGMLRYLGRVKGHLSDIKQNSGKRGH